MKKDKLWQVWVGIYGEAVGIIMIGMVISWDFVWAGARDLVHFSIGYLGTIAMLGAIALIIMSKHFKRTI